MIAIPYRGHYTVAGRHLTVFTCDLAHDAVAAGDSVQVGEVVIEVTTLERGPNGISGIVMVGTP